MKLLVAATLLSTVFCSTPSRSQSADAVYGFDPTLSSGGCPVGFAVRRTGALTGLLANQEGKTRAGAGFHLSLQTTLTPTIRSAEVIVRAVSPGAQVLPAGEAIAPEKAAGRSFAQSFHLAPRANSSLTHADVWLADASVLRSAELVAIEYRDGSSWHRSNGARCVAAPDLLVLTSVR